MNQELTEEDMRRALFGDPITPPPQPQPIEEEIVPDTGTISPLKPPSKKKAAKAFTPRLRVTLRAGNEFEGETFELTHDADTLSTLLAEQEATKAARKKYRYVEVISVKPV
ncbi:hypothetical protein [Pseudomonas graminis]|uniref:Uncharacterized protein n=1 Tax=Pseudomonas graminis TaxID=158627 RepID=A0A1C2ECX5_9PSED|nr:hypothetical protein [Pseudomonas graminis]OCX24813.1 hypothetical protein BBI10_04130 [Pseudomonas graminis]